ncbi:MnhB domain-containing protein [Halorussus amylolyticus]|uniref:MnhB domain-containing protein n=1 Tax=Halorussus amylolyticus TaxID=1126242 RepID=UPI00105202BB|nr:MnhB domain-containing protein [Halorussus amylolyticus]
MSDASANGAPSNDETESDERTVRPYVESPIIMATVRVVAPFVFTFGLFIMFHGADSSGGGFQGGVIVGTVILMLGIAFGIEPTREWVDPRTLVSLVGVGVLVFLVIGFGTVVAGGGFLDYDAVDIYHANKYGIELVELAIGVIVSGIITGLFFAIAAGASGGESA